MNKAIIAVLLLLGVIAYGLCPTAYKRIKSPDEKYVATAYYHRFKEWLPLSPGQGGDKAGWIEIRSSSGIGFGSQKVEMASKIDEIQWMPGIAEIRLVGAWNFEERSTQAD